MLPSLESGSKQEAILSTLSIRKNVTMGSWRQGSSLQGQTSQKIVKARVAESELNA